ncbi:MAG: hypothetical protein NW237_06285 [Cyanobacteriota bacterium]|nr:hypothetical protein [Cyanobacteriota bacterium]
MTNSPSWLGLSAWRTMAPLLVGMLSGSLVAYAPAWGIPGQSTDATLAWIRENPYLQAKPSDQYSVNRTEPDGSRFTFLASVAPPGRVIAPADKETIRSERMTFFRPNGLDAEQLNQAIRDLYGPEIAADLDQAVEVVRYPSLDVLNQPPSGNNLQQAIQGVIRQGQQLTYWLELTQNPDGTVQQGQVVVFEAEWLDKVKGELAARTTLTVTQP